MIVNQNLLIGLGIMMGIYIMYKIMFNKSKISNDNDYQRVYNKVLTSEEYKVKGQYNK